MQTMKDSSGNQQIKDPTTSDAWQNMQNAILEMAKQTGYQHRAACSTAP